MNDFNTLVGKSLDGTAVPKARQDTLTQHAQQRTRLRDLNADKNAALGDIIHWIMFEAGVGHVNVIERLATHHKLGYTLYLHYDNGELRIQKQWWLPLRVKPVNVRRTAGQRLLRQFSLKRIADGVATLVKEQGYQAPNFD